MRRPPNSRQRLGSRHDRPKQRRCRPRPSTCRRTSRGGISPRRVIWTSLPNRTVPTMQPRVVNTDLPPYSTNEPVRAHTEGQRSLPLTRRTCRHRHRLRGRGRGRLHGQLVTDFRDPGLKQDQQLGQATIPFGGNLTPQCGRPLCNRHLDRRETANGLRCIQPIRKSRTERLIFRVLNVKSDDQTRFIHPPSRGGGTRPIHRRTALCSPSPVCDGRAH